MVLAFSRRALTAFAVCAAALAFAQTTATAESRQGRPPAPRSAATPLAVLNLGQIAPAFVFSAASFATGAVGLRNRSEGGVSISGVSLPMRKAFVYWAVVTNGAPTAAVSNIYVKRGAANGQFTNIAGTAIGTGASPCWLGDRTTVFRGTIPLSVANGNGLYLMLLRPNANGNTGGQNPWDVSNPPLFEGATIVLVGTGASTVAVYDTPLAGRMFNDVLTYKLSVPVSVAGASEVLFHNIGADGQTGVGVEDSATTSGETTKLNGRLIAGPGSPAGSGDWNGGAATPLPQLWDSTTHNVTTAAQAAVNPLLLPFIVKVPDDCLVSVANVVSIKP